MFGFGKKQEPVKVAIPREDLPLDTIIEWLSDPDASMCPPPSDTFQSLLVHLGSDFKVFNRDPARLQFGTNTHRATLLCVALLLEKMKQ